MSVKHCILRCVDVCAAPAQEAHMNPSMHARESISCIVQSIKTCFLCPPQLSLFTPTRSPLILLSASSRRDDVRDQRDTFGGVDSPNEELARLEKKYRHPRRESSYSRKARDDEESSHAAWFSAAKKQWRQATDAPYGSC